MRQRTKVEGTKIAQAAKDLNVTSVTIRRYLAEFNIKTATDENGIKVLPPVAMDELMEVRRLKEEGLTNPKVLEILAEKRTGQKSSQVEHMMEEEVPRQEEQDEDEPVSQKQSKLSAVDDEINVETAAETSESGVQESEGQSSSEDGKAKHSLTCQTCGKTFEHTNPRLRDCLDCYRTKRKERRRGGDKHKNVIQHPIAQQVANKAAQLQNTRNGGSTHEDSLDANGRSTADEMAEDNVIDSRTLAASAAVNQAIPAVLRGPVRSYRKAIEETRQITSSLKRRLERPDLHEGERRWLEQIYAYQLILHQGWRHLSEYKSGNTEQS